MRAAALFFGGLVPGAVRAPPARSALCACPPSARCSGSRPIPALRGAGVAPEFKPTGVVGGQAPACCEPSRPGTDRTARMSMGFAVWGGSSLRSAREAGRAGAWSGWTPGGRCSPGRRNGRAEMPGRRKYVKAPRFCSEARLRAAGHAAQGEALWRSLHLQAS